MPITHDTVVGIADDGSPVGSDAWNEAHVGSNLVVDNTVDPPFDAVDTIKAPGAVLQAAGVVILPTGNREIASGTVTRSMQASTVGDGDASATHSALVGGNGTAFAENNALIIGDGTHVAPDPSSSAGSEAGILGTVGVSHAYMSAHAGDHAAGFDALADAEGVYTILMLLGYDDLPASDPNVKGQIYRDGNNLCVSGGIT